MGSLRGVGSSLLGPQIDEAEVHAASLGVGSELTTSLLAAGAAELPCTVKLRIWRHDIKDPCVTLEPEACRLTISHAVLCRCFIVLLVFLYSHFSCTTQTFISFLLFPVLLCLNMYISG